MSRRMVDKGDLAIGFAVVISVALVVGAAIDAATATNVSIGNGTVVTKVYTPASHGSGVGYGTGSNSGPVVVVTSTPEEWVLVISINGETFSKRVDPNTWGSYEKGQSIEVFERRGMFGTLRRTVKSQ